MTLVGSNRSVGQMARRVRSLQRGSFDSLLRGGVYNEDEARAILPYLEVRYDPSGYRIAIVRARGSSRQRFDDDPSPSDDAERVLRVHVGERGFVYRRREGEFVVFWSDPDPADDDRLCSRLAIAAAELESRSGVALEYAVGERRTSLVEAGRSLRDAEQRLGVDPTAARSVDAAADQTVPASVERLLSTTGDTPLCGREPARAIQRYILGHYHDPSLTLGAIAKHFGLTETYLSQVFHEQTGVTYSVYLERIRVDAAARLLSRGSLGVAEVAARVGYRINSTFFRAFRRVHGVAPSAYRRR